MKTHMKGLAIFLLYMAVTNVVIAPIVRKITPKDAAGNPVIVLM